MLKHALVSALPPDPRPGVIQPADWNADHVFSVDPATNILLKLSGVTEKALVVDVSNTPTNNAVEIWGQTASLAFKDAGPVPTIQYGYVIGGGTDALGGVSGLRVGGGGGPLSLMENGGFVGIGGVLSFGGYLVTHPSIRRSATELQFKTATNSAFTPIRASNMFANGGSLYGNLSGFAGYTVVGDGGLADPTWGGVWIGNATPSFSNYAFLANIAADGSGTTLFNTPKSTNVIEFRVVNNGRLGVGNSGVVINHASGTVPSVPLAIKSANSVNLLLSLSDAGALQLRNAGLGAFAAGDKYLVIDASGNVHVSGLGPAS